MLTLLRTYPPAELWRPDLLAALLAVMALYLVLMRVRRATAAQAAAFGLGLLTLYVSEGTPLHVLAEGYLFSAHMLQHMLLALLAPALMLWGLPAGLGRALIRVRPFGAVVRVAVHPLVALLVYNFVYSIYHLPYFYEAGLRYPVLHGLEHTVLIVTGAAMWWPVLSPAPEARLPEGLQILYLFGQGVAQTAVFALITYADHAIYAFYALAPRVVGLSPLEDQALAGFIMRFGNMVVLFVPLFWTLTRWIRREVARFPL